MATKSIHYLIDGETTPVTSSRILGVRFNTDTSDTTGGFIVRVDEALSFDPAEVTTLSELLAVRASAVLEEYPGFTSSVSDDLLDTTGLDFAASTICQIGSRRTTKIYPGGQLDTVAIPLGSTPTQAVVTWEVFRIVRSNDRTGRCTFEYEDAASAELTVTASFNNGSTFQAVTDGGMYSIALADQGTDLVLRFENAGSETWGLASWTVVYS